MVRRVVEEDIHDPVVVDHDSSWVGRTIVTLVLIALVVIGAVWLVRNVVNDDSGPGSPNQVEVDVNDNRDGNGGEEPAPQPT